MAKILTTSDECLKLLDQKPVIAMVGASANKESASNRVLRYLLSKGFEVIPVNPRYDQIEGCTCFPTLSDIPKDRRVTVVDVFRKAKDIPAIADEAVKVPGVTLFWMQLGISNDDSARKLIDHGIDVIMDRCIKIECSKLDI